MPQPPCSRLVAFNAAGVRLSAEGSRVVRCPPCLTSISAGAGPLRFKGTDADGVSLKAA